MTVGRHEPGNLALNYGIRYNEKLIGGTLQAVEARSMRGGGPSATLGRERGYEGRGLEGARVFGSTNLTNDAKARVEIRKSGG